MCTIMRLRHFVQIEDALAHVHLHSTGLAHHVEMQGACTWLARTQLVHGTCARESAKA